MKTLLLMAPYYIAVIIIVLTRNWGIKKAKKAHEKGLQEGSSGLHNHSLGKPISIKDVVVHGESYHVVYIFRIGEIKHLILQNANTHEVNFCKIPKEQKLTVDRDRTTPVSGKIYSARVSSMGDINFQSKLLRR